MSKTIKLLSLFLFFLIFSTYIPNHKRGTKSYIFPIKIIIVENNRAIDDKKLISELDYLKGKSLFFLEQYNLTKTIMNHDFVMNFQVKKIFPHTVKIIINEKKPVAIYINGKNKFYVPEEGELIRYKKLDYYNNLPLVSVKSTSLKKTSFKSLFKEMKKIDFPVHEIKLYNYFDVDRWDIILKNNKIIKLPGNNYIETLKKFLLIKNDKNFEKYKIFDYRVINQLILN